MKKTEKEMSEQAKIDFEEALNKDNFAASDSIFENNLLDLLRRVKAGQYPPEFFAYQGAIYWRCICKYFRESYDSNIAKTKQEARKQALNEVRGIIDRWINKNSDNKGHWFECGSSEWEELQQKISELEKK